MPARHIPLFPLQAVVFPRTRLPLHIFEERYKEMIGNAIRDHSEFGVVLAKENGIVSAGCTVMVEKVLETYPDGRMDILTRGVRRFEIVELSGEKAYLQAEVSFFDDDDSAPAPAELREQALSNLSGPERAGRFPMARRAGPPGPATQFSTGAGAAGPGFSARAAGVPLRNQPAQGSQPLPGGVHSAPAPHRAREAPGSHQRFRRRTLGAVAPPMRHFLLIDADDTLWENNIYFERAFDEFAGFLDHSSMTPRQVRDGPGPDRGG